MLRMIDRHAVQQMLTAGVRIGEVTRYFEVSRRTIERIRKEPAVEGAQWPAAPAPGGGAPAGGEHVLPAAPGGAGEAIQGAADAI
jgi:transposase